MGGKKTLPQEKPESTSGVRGKRRASKRKALGDRNGAVQATPTNWEREKGPSTDLGVGRSGGREFNKKTHTARPNAAQGFEEKKATYEERTLRK